MQQITSTKQLNFIFWSIFLLTVVVFHLLYGQFFPNDNGGLGHDYSYFLPMLVNGYYWFENNGLFEVPWFTPAFCAGLPYYPNPQSMYYSIPQLLTILSGPLPAIYATFILFAALGYAGFYLLARRVFETSVMAASLGAAVFMFNGFYGSRMVIGHLTVHSFMLVPLIAFCILQCAKKAEDRKPVTTTFLITAAGFLIAYFIHSGAVNYLLPFLIAISGIYFLFKANGGSEKGAIRYFLLSGLVGFLLSMSKLFASLFFIAGFPRDHYSLPAFGDVWTAFQRTFELLFLGIADGVTLVNSNYALQQHEFEYGISLVPFLFIAAFFVLALFRKIQGLSKPLSRKRLFYLLLFVLVLIIPVMINAYSPGWNSLLKSLPYFKSSSNLVRWLTIDIVLLALASSLVADSICHARFRFIVTAMAIMVVIGFHFWTDKSYYHKNLYRAESMTAAYTKVQSGAEVPAIYSVGALTNQEGQILKDVIGRNDTFVAGVSQLACYEAIFGYHMEMFPKSGLTLGPVMSSSNGRLNFRNPACYVFGPENNCRAGDHFSLKEADKAQRLLDYQPFPFNVPASQQLANRLNLVAILMFLLIFPLLCLSWFAKRRAA